MKRIVILLALLLVAAASRAQDGTVRDGRWEIGAGASVMQFSRVGFVDFTTTDEGHSVGMQLRHAVAGVNVSVVRTLSDRWAADFQATVGAGDRKLLALAGVGVQWRLGSYFHSRQIDPYVRLGGNYLYKGFDTMYGGSVDGMDWNMVDGRNSGMVDAHHLFAVAGGAGVNMWLCERFGIGLQGDYLLMPRRGVAGSMQGTVRLMWRLGCR